MNEESPPSFDTLGDVPVEARIVAWVLGETSAFEAAELERLCEERPELLVFRRRMRALHGLLTEAEAAEKDHSWKLPPEKRKVLDEIFGEEKVTRLEPSYIRPESHKEQRIRRSSRRTLLAIAACLILTIIIAKMIGPISRIGPMDFAKNSAFSETRPATAQETESSLHALNKAVRDQEDKVEERRKVLATIVRTKGIIYKGQDSFYGQSRVDEDQGARSALQTFNALEQEKMQLESQVGSLLKYDSDQLMTYASGVSLPDNTVRNLLPQYNEAKRHLESAKINGLGDDHPSVKAAAEQVQAAKRQVDDGVVNLRATLQSQLEMVNDRLKKVEVMKDDSREEAIKRGLDAQDYVDAKRDFESDQQLLQALKLKQIEKTIEAKISNESLAANEPATPAPLADGTYRMDSKPEGLDIGGMAQSKKQSQLAKQSPQSRPRAVPPPAPSQSSVAQSYLDSSEMDQLPAIAASGLGEGGGFHWSDKADSEARVAGSDIPPVVSAASTTDGQDAFRRLSLDESVKRSDRGTALGRSDNFGILDKAKESQKESVSASSDLTDEESSTRLLEEARYSTVPSPANPSELTASTNQAQIDLLSRVESVFELEVPATDMPNDRAARPEMSRELQDPAENEPLPAEDAKLLVDLITEIPAAETPYSTFSLNISDASFQLAKAALAKGERPDPASIKPEQFYNAVDYGDPAPTSNEPVAATIEQSAHPVIPGRNLVRVALRTGAVGRSAIQPLRLTLLVDQSGSMVREDRHASMEYALAQLGILLTKADLVTVIGFSRTPHLLADGMTGDQATKLSELVNQTASEGGTNLEEAMKLGGQLAERHQLADAQNRIVLFTDGAANLGDANPTRLAEQVKAFRQQGLAFDIAGIGADGLNDRLLSELARNGNGRYYVVGNEKNDSFARQLAGAFRPAAENVKVQVNFNPQRVGKYKLIGFEKDRLKTEDFRNDAVDAAELAAEEAGVAIYQVETLADGSGELGEVSVRFRDMASGEMVERTWSMPYDAQATAFDRATPSMQLAGLSLLAAEKLKGGPLADAIEFNQLTGPTAFVKQFYGDSPRIGDMLRVIDALK